MSQHRTPTRGARVLGALLLAALAAVNLAWIVRDFQKAAEVTDVWWMWSGLLFRAQDGVWASSFVDPTLLVLYTVCAVTALRSSAATGILASSGVLTILVRVPTLWNLNANWVRGGVSEGLRSKALTSVIAMLVIGAVLVIIAITGRSPATASTDPTDPADPTATAATTSKTTGGEPPARPTPGGAIAAVLLLGAMAAVLTAWEIHSALDQGWELYSRHFGGDRGLVTLLAVPDSWLGWAMALLSLVAALAALTRAPYARPLGMTVCGPLLGLGGFYLSFAAKAGLLENFGDLVPRDQLRLATALFEILASLALLLALARRDEPAAEPAGAGDEEHAVPSSGVTPA